VAERKPEPHLSLHHIVVDSTLWVLVVVVVVVVHMSRIDPGTHMWEHWIVGKRGLLGAGLASEMGLEHTQKPVAEIQEEDSAGTALGPEHAPVPHELGYEAVVLVVGSWLRLLLFCTVDVPRNIMRNNVQIGTWQAIQVLNRKFCEN